QAKGDPKSQDSQLMAKTIVQNLRVIAVGKRLSAVPPSGNGANGPEEQPTARSVTVLATAEEAEAIDLARHVGRPRLVLRNGSDEETGQVKGVTVAELRGEPKETPVTQLAQLAPTTKPAATQAVETARQKNYREVEIIRAGAASRVRVE